VKLGESAEIFARTGAVRAGGSFAVVVRSGDERAAVALRDKLRDSGFPAISARTGGASEVRIEALGDRDEAAALAEWLRMGFAQAQAR
jgi:hypothetical protein